MSSMGWPSTDQRPVSSSTSIGTEGSAMPGLVRDLQLEPQDQRAPGLAVRIEIERRVHAAFERILHDEVEAVQVVELVAPHGPADEVRKGPRQALRRERGLHGLVVAGLAVANSQGADGVLPVR